MVMEVILNKIRDGLRKISNDRESDIPLLYSHKVEACDNGYRIHLAYKKVESGWELVQIFLKITLIESVHTGRLSINGFNKTDRTYEDIENPLLEIIYGYCESLIVEDEEMDLNAVAKIMKTDIDLTNDSIEPHSFT